MSDCLNVVGFTVWWDTYAFYFVTNLTITSVETTDKVNITSCTHEHTILNGQFFLYLHLEEKLISFRSDQIQIYSSNALIIYLH